jgi:hypothetical protein
MDLIVAACHRCQYSCSSLIITIIVTIIDRQRSYEVLCAE